MAEAIAEVKRPRFHIGPLVQSPRPAPRHRRALRFRRGRLWPLTHRLIRSCPTAPTGPEKRTAFPASGPTGRGHRRGHATPFPHRAGGPKPPASARPAGGGCFTPAGRALASRSHAETVLLKCSHGAEETRCVSGVRPQHRRPPGAITCLNWPRPLPRSCGTVSAFGPLAQSHRLSHPPRDQRALRFRRGRLWPLGHGLIRFCPTTPTGPGKRVAFSQPGPIGRGHRRGHATPFPHRAGGPKPTASARPAIGGRFAPAGAGSGLSVMG